MPIKIQSDLPAKACLLYTSDNEYGRSATALIYNNNLKNWNVTIDDVYKACLLYTS